MGDNSMPGTQFENRITRRECLRLAQFAALAGVAGASADAIAAVEPAKSAPKRRIFVSGGGLLTDHPDYRLLRFVVSLTGKDDPVVCDLPTASGDNLERIAMWYE